MNYKDELYHYGVKGMKWKGHVYSTKDELKDAKRKYKEERKEIKRDARTILQEERKIPKDQVSKTRINIAHNKGKEYYEKVSKEIRNIKSRYFVATYLGVATGLGIANGLYDLYGKK